MIRERGSQLPLLSRMAKRTYTRRTDADRISELEEKISKIKTRIETRKLKDSPVVREAAKVQRVLRKFAQLAADEGREDLANSVTAFGAGFERSLIGHFDGGNRRGKAGKNG